MRIARVVSVVPVDRVDESWKTLPDPGDFRHGRGKKWRSGQARVSCERQAAWVVRTTHHPRPMVSPGGFECPTFERSPFMRVRPCSLPGLPPRPRRRFPRLWLRRSSSCGSPATTVTRPCRSTPRSCDTVRRPPQTRAAASRSRWISSGLSILVARATTRPSTVSFATTTPSCTSWLPPTTPASPSRVARPRARSARPSRA